MNFANATAWDLSTDSTTLRSRTFTVTDNPGVVTFGSQLVTSSILGISFVKNGIGTLVLSNATNNFTGAISVTAGVLSIGSDGALGNLINTVTLNGGTGTLQVTGTFATNRDFTNATGGGQFIDVTGSNVFTINNSFVGGNALAKVDNGTLVLAGAANAFSTISIFGGGAVQSTATGTLSNNLGATSVVINGGTLALAPVGSAALTEPLVNYQGGSYISLTANGGTTQLIATLADPHQRRRYRNQQRHTGHRPPEPAT